MKQDGTNTVPETDVAISSRIRLARNLEAYPFAPRLSRMQGKEIMERVKQAVADSRDTDMRGLSFLEMHSMLPMDKQLLVEKHLISPEFVEHDNNRAVILSKDGKISIMVNEEDHLRLQCILPGRQIEEAWKLCNKIDTDLEEKLDFAFDRISGYLTCCPTNTGTGIRASIMLHLPALSMTGYIKGILETCSKIGVAVRGIYGENSEASGNMFQISNQITLGQSEEEILDGIGKITLQITEQERMLRAELYKQNPLRFEDRVFRSLGILLNARIMSAEESLKLLSDVRLGLITGMYTGMELEDFNEMMLMVQPAYLQKLNGEQLSPDVRDQKRAELIRQKLKSSIK